MRAPPGIYLIFRTNSAWCRYIAPTQVPAPPRPPRLTPSETNTETCFLKHLLCPRAYGYAQRAGKVYRQPQEFRAGAAYDPLTQKWTPQGGEMRKKRRRFRGPGISPSTVGTSFPRAARQPTGPFQPPQTFLGAPECAHSVDSTFFYKNGRQKITRFFARSISPSQT